MGDLPVNQRSLMWGEDELKIFAKADVVTPDKKSSWFSQIELVVDDYARALIQRRELGVKSTVTPDALNTISVTTFEERAFAREITAPGAYQIANGIVQIGVERDRLSLGALPREVAHVKTKGIEFS